MNRKLLMAVFIIFLAPSLVFAYRDCGVRFKDITGDVSVRPDDEDDDAYENAEFDTILHYKDRIKTDIDSEAVLGLTDKTSFIIKEKSILVLPEYEGEVSDVKMIAGVIWVNMKKIVNGGELRLDGTQAVAGIRGTAIRASTDGITDNFSLSHGRSRITIKETGKVIDLKPGQQIKIGPKGNYDIKPVNVSKLNEELKESMKNIGKSLDNSELIKEIKQYNNDIKKSSDELKNSIRKLQKRSSVSVQDVYGKSSGLESRVSEAEILIANASAKLSDKELGKAVSELSKTAGQARNLISQVAKLAGYYNEEKTEEQSGNTTETAGNKNIKDESSSVEEVVVDIGILDSLKDLEAELTTELAAYNTAHDEYNAAVAKKNKMIVLSRSLRIIGKFARITRRYDRAKKLYSNISGKLGRMQSAESQQQELEDIWRRIEDLYSSLSNEADILRNNIEDLQNKLNQGVLSGK